MELETSLPSLNKHIERDAVAHDMNVYELINLMREVNLESSDADLNANSISDGKGGRILL